jgi:glycosyltransferase involved in cell wall biosynthesis
VSEPAPRVSVGVPALNAAATLARALDSVLGQTLTDLEVIVSDNASTDGTEATGRRYAAADARVRYIRQPATVPALENFRRALAPARAPYFMWLAADDYALPRLLERAVAVLDARPEVVCCAPRVEFLEANGGRRRAPGTFPLLGGFGDNLRTFLHDPMDNSRFYGLFRRTPLVAALPRDGYHAYDWTVSVATLRAGLHAELDEVLLVRTANDPDKYTRMLEGVFPSALGRLAPLWPFTRALLLELRVPPSPATLFALARLNVVHHVIYARHRYPRYGRAVHRVTAGLERALTAAGLGRRGPAA